MKITENERHVNEVQRKILKTR